MPLMKCDIHDCAARMGTTDISGLHHCHEEQKTVSVTYYYI